jgi:hypothetical protein
MFILPSSNQFSFHSLSHKISRLIPTLNYNMSTEHILKRTCVPYQVKHVADTELSVHVYRSDTASETALQLQREDGFFSAQLHIITDVKRYTEHTVDVHSNRT